MCTMGRKPLWATTEGKTTVDALTDAYREHWAVFMEENGGAIPYVSRDMKSGIDVPGLVKNAPLITPSLILDPRGGYVSQVDMFGAISALSLEIPRLRLLIERVAGKKGLSRDNFLRDQAYCIRVMASHVRTKAELFKRSGDHTNKSHPDALVSMYNLITEASPKQDVRSWSSSSSGARCAFPAFREEDEDDEGSDVDDGDVTMVATYIDPTAKPIAAIKLLSDSSRKSTTYFVEGENSFAVAIFEDGSHFETEWPNSAVVDDELVQQPPIDPARLSTRKRPAPHQRQAAADPEGRKARRTSTVTRPPAAAPSAPVEADVVEADDVETDVVETAIPEPPANPGDRCAFMGGSITMGNGYWKMNLPKSASDSGKSCSVILQFRDDANQAYQRGLEYIRTRAKRA